MDTNLQQVVAFPGDEVSFVGRAAEQTKKFTFGDVATSELALEKLLGSISVSRLNRWYIYNATKRAIDIVAAAIGLAVLSPLMILVALLIKLQDGGPILFHQTRVGRLGRPFRFYKFRSMVVNAEALKARLAADNRHGDHRSFKMSHDPRITTIGRIIRRLSIDELPQLYNVLIGDMSLVGPRPSTDDEVSLYSEYDRTRLMVKPGLTCIWQVSGRSQIGFEDQLLLDLEYIERRSFWFDMALIFRTFPAVLGGRGAE